jgi:hypothetical protein
LAAIANGGHLGWIKGIPNLKKLYWVDCETIAPTITKADNRHAAVFADIRGQALTIEETIEEIMKIFNIPTPNPFQPNVALVYIETNTNHKKEWKYLKSRIEEIWHKITYPNKNTLPIVCHALPLEDYQKVRNMPFNNLDGIVLLWGEKDQFAIQEQVGEIDKLITAQKSTPVPGIVAYLTPPAKLLREQPLATGWDVARFDNNPENFHEHIDDTDILKDFLSDVMRRYTSKQ